VLCLCPFLFWVGKYGGVCCVLSIGMAYRGTDNVGNWLGDGSRGDVRLLCDGFRYLGQIWGWVLPSKGN